MTEFLAFLAQHKWILWLILGGGLLSLAQVTFLYSPTLRLVQRVTDRVLEQMAARPRRGDALNRAILEQYRRFFHSSLLQNVRLRIVWGTWSVLQCLGAGAGLILL